MADDAELAILYKRPNRAQLVLARVIAEFGHPVSTDGHWWYGPYGRHSRRYRRQVLSTVTFGGIGVAGAAILGLGIAALSVP